jgi:PAS domain S-box-containing protein
MSVATSLRAPRPARRLVIIEDEGILALDLERTLTASGFDVRGVAGDSDAALELVERERPELALMDIRIQGPRDGIETARLLRERFDVPVVFLTAHSDGGTIERAHQTQPLGYLLKPFKRADLQNIVTIALARHDAEQEVRQREAALRTTLSCLGEAVITTDARGAVTSWNRAATELIGRAENEVLSQRFLDAVPLRSEEGTLLTDDPVLALQHVDRLSLTAKLDGRTVAGTVASLHRGTDRYGAVVALRDLTELLEARHRLELAARLTSIGVLAAGVAHEINNPLSVVMSNVSYALDATEAGETKDALAEASDAAKRVATIVRDMNEFARPQAEPLNTFDPRHALATAIALTRSSWRQVTGVVLDLRDAPPVLASQTRLSQVVVNLIINALHAMESVGGRAHCLTLSTSTDEHGRAVLQVRDTGSGIAPEVVSHIFEPFFTTKARGKGTGLGLAISQSIIESYGGAMAVTSSPEGTTFTLTLPPAPDPSAVEPQETDDEPLELVWLGPDDGAAATLGCEVLATGQALQERLAARRPAAVLLSEAGQAQLAPEFEAQALHVGHAAPARGALWVRPPVDLPLLHTILRR